MAKCKYFSEDPKIEAWQPECIGEDIRQEDILGKYCPFCGKEIKYKPHKSKED